MYGITHAFLLRYRLAGQHCFIQPDFTLNYLTVYRDTIAGRQPQRHAELHLRQRDVFLAIVGHQARRRRRQIQQPFQRL